MEIFKEIKKTGLHNASFKASALLLALLTWFYFFSEREGISFRLGATGSVNAGVMVLAQPHSLHSAGIIPGTVELTVRGARGDVRALGPDDFKVFIETKGLPAGVYSLPVRAFTLRPVEIISKQPSRVTVYIRENRTIQEERK